MKRPDSVQERNPRPPERSRGDGKLCWDRSAPWSCGVQERQRPDSFSAHEDEQPSMALICTSSVSPKPPGNTPWLVHRWPSCAGGGRRQQGYRFPDLCGPLCSPAHLVEKVEAVDISLLCLQQLQSYFLFLWFLHGEKSSISWAVTQDFPTSPRGCGPVPQCSQPTSNWTSLQVEAKEGPQQSMWQKQR